MKDNEIVLKLIELGLVTSKAMCWHALMDGKAPSAVFNSVKALVRDWRVAGALMEQCELVTVVKERGPLYVATASFPDRQGKQCDSASSMPRAIIEACVEALDTDGDRET